MLRAASERVANEDLRGRLGLALAPMDRLPAADRRFDLIVAHGIWNLARSAGEFRRAVAEAARVARSGAGLFVFTFSRHTLPEDATPLGEEAFVWTRATGMRRLADVLAIERGLDLSGWERLVSADGVSDDGLVVVGRGLAGGVERAFVAVLEGPCSNQVDDDGDTLADLLDPGCTSAIDVSELGDCATTGPAHASAANSTAMPTCALTRPLPSAPCGCRTCARSRRGTRPV